MTNLNTKRRDDRKPRYCAAFIDTYCLHHPVNSCLVPQKSQPMTYILILRLHAYTTHKCTANQDNVLIIKLKNYNEVIRNWNPFVSGNPDKPITIQQSFCCDFLLKPIYQETVPFRRDFNPFFVFIINAHCVLFKSCPDIFGQNDAIPCFKTHLEVTLAHLLSVSCKSYARISVTKVAWQIIAKSALLSFYLHKKLR